MSCIVCSDDWIREIRAHNVDRNGDLWARSPSSVTFAFYQSTHYYQSSPANICQQYMMKMKIKMKMKMIIKMMLRFSCPPLAKSKEGFTSFKIGSWWAIEFTIGLVIVHSYYGSVFHCHKIARLPLLMRVVGAKVKLLLLTY